MKLYDMCAESLFLHVPLCNKGVVLVMKCRFARHRQHKENP